MGTASAQTEEYAAATGSVAWADLSTRELLRITGEDRVSFVHGMVTNDIKGLAVGASCYAAMLTPKGAMVGDARIVNRVDDVLLDTGPGRGQAVKDFLNKFLISEDAEIHDAPECAVLGLVGPNSAATALTLKPFTLATLPASLKPGIDVVVARENWAEVLEQLKGVTRLSADTFDVLRVEQGVPVFGTDMTETTIPLEANLDSAIHYNKGCYIGQEVIARATYRGQMNKKLVGVLLGDAEIPRLTELRVAEKKVGWLTSVVKSQLKGQNVALAYVQRDHLTPGTRLDVATGGQCEVSALPFR